MSHLFHQVSLHFSKDDICFYFLEKRTILMHLYVALPISTPFTDGTCGQEQPLDGRLELILFLK